MQHFIRTLPLLIAASLALTGCESAKRFVDAQTTDTHKSFDGRLLENAAARRLTGEPGPKETKRLADDTSKAVQRQAAELQYLEAYAQRILDKLLTRYPHPKETIKIIVTTGDGYMPVSFGKTNVIDLPFQIVSDLESEDEFAFILAHEAAHILLNHHALSASSEVVEEVAGFAALLGITGATQPRENFANALSQGNRTISQSEILGNKTAGKVLAANMMINTLEKNVFGNAWKRTQEEEADILAADLVYEAGYSHQIGNRVIEVIEAFQTRADEVSKKQKEAWGAALGLAAGTVPELQKAATTSSSADRTVLLSLAAAKAFEALSATGTLGREHPSPDVRQASLEAYFSRAYEEADIRLPQRESFRKAVYGAPQAAALARRLGVDQVRKLLSLRRLADARSSGLSFLRSPSDTNPEVRKLLADIEIADNQPITARDHLKLAIRDRAATPEMFDTLIQLHRDLKAPREALAVFEERLRRFPGDRYRKMPVHIELLREAGRPGEAARVLADCQRLGDPESDLVQACRAAYAPTTL